MNKKYELTDEIKVFLGIELHRIKALVDIGAIAKAGDLGGWLEKEDNLSQNGDAWVYGEARVYGDAWVYGDARVYDNAWDVSPLQIQGTRWLVNMSTDTTLKIGCQTFALKMWAKNWRKIAESNDTKAIAVEYALYVNLAIERYGKGKITPIDITAVREWASSDE
jgi:hypothetical protein